MINSTRSDDSDNARLLLGTDNAMRKLIRRTRSKLNPPVPSTLDDLVISDEWTETLADNPERFLFYDNRTDAQSRIILFGSESALRKLASSTTWFIDGNFAMAPPGFLQMYVIRVPLGTTAITTVYALLQNKSQDTYDEMYRTIMNYCEVLGLFPDPLTVLCDFELAVIRSVNDVLGGDINIQACFYHFTQATWRKIQELVLVQCYKTDEDFKMLCAKLDGLAFLPIDDVIRGFDFLRASTPEGAEQLVQYFAQTYVIGRYRRAEANNADGGVPVSHAAHSAAISTSNLERPRRNSERRTAHQQPVRRIQQPILPRDWIQPPYYLGFRYGDQARRLCSSNSNRAGFARGTPNKTKQEGIRSTSETPENALPGSRRRTQNHRRDPPRNRIQYPLETRQHGKSRRT